MANKTQLLADALRVQILGSLLCGGGLLGCDAEVREVDGGGGSGGPATGGGAVGAASATGGGGAGGTGGSFYRDCSDSGVGVCCSYTLCFTHEQLAPFVTMPDGPNCPPFEELQPTAFCDWFTAGPLSEGPDECCYDMRGGSCCGRPFLVAGVERRARAVSREGWASTPVEPAVDMPAALRERLRDAWLDDALMEHASVAAFARFTLQLLGLGAPADLVGACQRAARDEIEHAEACFMLASRYAGEPLGPSGLSLEGAFATEEVTDIVVNTFLEGCVGETVASLLAAEQLRCVEDLQTRAVLERIVRDEAAHSELAWRFVGWAIGEYGDVVRSTLASALEQARSSPPHVDSHDLDEHLEWRAAGRLSAAQKRAVWQSAMERVVTPCAMALLAGSSKVASDDSTLRAEKQTTAARSAT